MAKKKATKKAAKKTTKKKAAGTSTQRNFPTMPIEEALLIAETIEKHAAGQPMRRLTLFDTLGKSPDSGPSRSLVTASGKYGLTTGGYRAEEIALTDMGRRIVSEGSSRRDKYRAMYEAAIAGVDPFFKVHQRFVDNKLPSTSVLKDFLISEAGVSSSLVQECIDTFIVNAKEVGVLRELAGAERLLSIDHVVDELPAAMVSQSAYIQTESSDASVNEVVVESNAIEWGQTCFYVTPIGEPDSDLRKHSDLFLEHIVEPALSPMEIEVVRADRIGQPGMITRRVLEYVLRSRLVVADLSHHNPNVFYELSLRHACGLPTIQIIRADDRIPFDLKDFDTIQIDDSDIYTMIPKLEVYRSQIATQARSVLQDGATIDNPIVTYFPELRVSVN